MPFKFKQAQHASPPQFEQHPNAHYQHPSGTHSDHVMQEESWNQQQQHQPDWHDYNQDPSVEAFGSGLVDYASEEDDPSEDPAADVGGGAIVSNTPTMV